MRTLFSCQYGSTLYGTNTPESDVDWKHIILPDINDLILGKRLENKVCKTNTKAHTRNTVDDVDEEFIPIQTFAQHFTQGQTYALELAFALEGTHATQTVYDHRFIHFVRELRSKYLTRNISALVGYVVNQASIYSFKGERLNTVRDVLALVSKMDEHYFDETTKTDVIVQSPWNEALHSLLGAYPNYLKLSEYDIGGGIMRPCLKVLEKTLPFTNSLTQSLKVLNALKDKYGTRANQASTDNVDWKAMMHAVRIVDEGIALLQEKQLTFPFHITYTKFLLDIKRGVVPLEQVKDILTTKLDKLKSLESTSTLPEADEVFQAEFKEWMIVKMREFYSLEA